MHHLTMAIIAHELQELGRTVCLDDGNPSFRDVRLYDAGRESADKDKLYLCDAAAIPREGIAAASVMVVVEPGSDEQAPAGNGVCARFETTASVIEVFTALQDVFLRYGEWQCRMDSSCLASEGVQALLDMSTSFLMNNIVIVDPALKLLGYSRDVPCDDPVTMELIANGYHTESNIQKFKLNKRFEPWAREQGFIVNASHRICKYDTVVWSFKTRDSFSLIVVMMCNVIAPERWVLDGFRMLLARIKHYADRDYPEDKPSGSAVDAFLRDLLSNKPQDENILRERCEHVNIPYEARFCLFCVPEKPESVPTLRLLADVARVVAPAKTLNIDGMVVVVCFNCKSESCARRCASGTCPLAGRAVSARLNELLARYGIVCGRSSKFSKLSEAYPAFLQAKAAARVGERECDVRPRVPLARNWENIYSFDRCCIDYLVECNMKNGFNLVRYSYSCRLLDEIAAADAEQNTDNYEFLYQYLRYERRASVVAEKLHMHRNNVKYRIDRIESAFGIDTSNPSLRFDIIMAYCIRESDLMHNAQEKTTNKVTFVR